MKLYYDKLKERVYKKIEEQRNLELISKSGLFDKAWYLAKNPDVLKEAHIDPLSHYLKTGGFEGRDPGPLFCSRWYLNSYEDVPKTGLNPLVHYLTMGREKGYQPQSVVMNFVNATFCATCDAYINNYYPHHSESPKIFCVGHNKTGTTSLGAVLQDFGYKLGFQGESEILMADWVVRDFRRIIEFCKTADVFQDVPFSLDFTYQAVDQAFPGSKFILTVRNDPDEWFDSLVRFYRKIIGVNGIPSVNDLKKYEGGGIGWLWRFQNYVYDANEDNLFDRNLYKQYYQNHNARIVEYFRYRQMDFLVLNLSDPSAMRSLCNFLGVKYTGQVMPHLNRSKE